MLRTTPLLLLCLLGAACASQTKMSSDPKPRHEPAVEQPAEPARPVEATAPVPKPVAWTKAFDKGAILVGKTIRVEGPPGLMTHAALTVDDTVAILEQRTTEQGFLQVLVPREGAGRELRCQLGRWTLAAADRIEVLERIVPCDVLVVAEGAAFWRDLNNNVQREERLEFRGVQPKE
ncbi:MAG: hypothetical protein P1V35_01815 [Planctomycetota bacterium]|nr:hypothetical protein [Planctomycetota bacterium]